MKITSDIKALFESAQETGTIEACWGLFSKLSDNHRYDGITQIYEKMLPTLAPGILHTYISENLDSRKTFLKYKDRFVQSYEESKQGKEDIMETIANDMFHKEQLSRNQVERIFIEWSQYFDDHYDDPSYSDDILDLLDRFHEGWDKGNPILPYEDKE